MTSAEVRHQLLRLDPSLVHPALGIESSLELRTGDWTGPMAEYAATLVAMSDSDRMPNEFAVALAVMNPLLEARLTAEGERATRLDALAAELQRHAQAVRDARSGMACDICLDYFESTLDDARKELGLTGGRSADA